MEENKEHEYCLRCGRKLKKPETRKIGYGIICARKMKVEESQRLFRIRHENAQTETKKQEFIKQ